MLTCSDALSLLEAGDLTFIEEVDGVDGYFDIELLAEPHADRRKDEPIGSALARRVGRIREAFAGRRACDLLVVWGDPSDGTGAVRSADDPGHAVAELARHGPETIVVAPPATGDAAVPVVAVARVGSSTDDGCGPLAMVAVVAFHPGYASLLEEQVTAAERLIRLLATREATHEPLFVVAVAARDAARDREFLVRLERSRVSLILHPSSAQPGIAAVKTAPSDPHGHATELAVVGCPTMKAGVGHPGATQLRIDAKTGVAEIVFGLDMGSDRPAAPRQFTRRLTSASRISSDERRLYGTVRTMLERADREQNPDAEAFAAYVTTTWEKDGYVPLCWEDGHQLGLEPKRFDQYMLLLLLRRGRDGSYDLLMTQHTSLTRPAIAEWDVPLVTAFTNVRVLLERLRDDVIRQAAERPADIDSAERARALDAAVEFVVTRAGGPDLWADEIRQLGSPMTVRKLSPSNGVVTEHDYRFVTLVPLVERPNEDAGDDEALARRKIILWLTHLDGVGRPGDDPPPPLLFDAVKAGGTATRWDPHTGFGDPDRPILERSPRLPRGAIWFPLGVDDKGWPLWQSSPAIVARNADVMRKVDEVLEGYRLPGTDRYPDHIVLGSVVAGSKRFELLRRRTFNELLDRLRRVTLNPKLGLGHIRIYEHADVERVYLVRTTVAGPRGHERDVIAVYPRPEEPASGLADRATVLAKPRLGLLRPVQRYALTAGMRRAAALAEEILPAWHTEPGDPWGFVEIRRGSHGNEVVMTPPILEEVPIDERESDELEFLVCDGNHRILHNVWGDGADERQPFPAIAVRGELPQRYYALPFSRFEWGVTARNVVSVTPDDAWKYQARDVPADVPAALRARKDAYRRWYRDFNTAFGDFGGQGGAY